MNSQVEEMKKAKYGRCDQSFHTFSGCTTLQETPYFSNLENPVGYYGGFMM